MNLIKDSEWGKAHDIIEAIDTPIACHIHAFLHRIEGDQWNAHYWYRKAGVTLPDYSLDEEWEKIMQLLP